MSDAQESGHRKGGEIARSIIFRLASYNTRSLDGHRRVASAALAFVAKEVALAQCGSQTYTRMLHLARLAIDKLAACHALNQAAVEWSDIVESEDENRLREQRLIIAMENLDSCVELFGNFCENF